MVGRRAGRGGPSKGSDLEWTEQQPRCQGKRLSWEEGDHLCKGHLQITWGD